MRAFFEPISEAQSPRLAHRLQKNALLCVEVSLFMATVVHLADVLRGRAEPMPSLLVIAVSALLNLPLYLVMTRSHRLRPGRAEWVGAIAALVSMADLVATATIIGAEPSPAYLPYIGVIPFGFAAIIDWRPLFPLALGAIGAAVAAVVGRGAFGLSWSTMELWIALSVALGIVGMVTGQSRRRFWLELDRTDARNRLVAADRLAQLGRVSGTLAHEVKSPLAAALNELAVARSLSDELQESIGRDGVNDEDLREIVGELDQALASSQRGIDQASRVIQSMRDHTRTGGTASRGAFAIRERLDACLQLHSRRLQSVGVTASIDCAEEVLVGPSVHFDQAVTNLITNAIDVIESSGSGSAVRLVVTRRPSGTLLSIIDDGPGVPPELSSRVFEQGVTSKTDGRGLGLGLWICRNLLESSFGGQVSLDTTTLVGARFDCWFPSAPVPKDAGDLA